MRTRERSARCPRRLIRELNKGGTNFIPTHGHLKTRVSRTDAIRDAVKRSPWRGTATGITLVRIGPAGPARARHALIWLVSIRPFTTQYPPSYGPVSPHGGLPQRPRAENYFAVTISANTAAFISGAAGYDPSF